MKRLSLLATIPLVGTYACVSSNLASDVRAADVIIVGAGIAGLSAAVEIAAGGGDVMVVDMSSVFGGHAVSAHGGLAIVGSPVQAAANIEDNPDLAYTDFITWGEDADEEWVRYYVDNSRTEIHDWVVQLGVTFEDLWHIAGNSVPRFHNVRGRGLGLVTPIYLAALRRGVRFQWNTRVDGLIAEGGRITGVAGTYLRTLTRVSFRAPIVLIATGGFQSNIERVREHWDSETPFPDRILAGSGWNSQGLGLDLARQVDAQFHRLDHQWNYVTGLPDPRYPNANRGLNLLADRAIWVNVAGERFVNECASVKETFPALLRQPTGSYWSILDSRTREDLVVSGSGWTEAKIDSLIFDNPDLVKTASTLEELASSTGLPTASLEATVARFNRSVDEGIDSAFGRFGRTDDPALPCPEPQRLDQPPYYAIRLYALARKSMGGVTIDRQGHVLDQRGRVIPGLYAAGEVTGFGGINGKAGLEGTFLGPSILTGRVSGRSIVSELASLGIIGSGSVSRNQISADQVIPPSPTAEFDNENCTDCHDLGSLVADSRPGYWHFELAHRSIIESRRQCSQCHVDLYPYEEDDHRADPFERARSCGHCHGLQVID